MILCKKCGELASWNSHFQKYMCSSCYWTGDKIICDEKMSYTGNMDKLSKHSIKIKELISEDVSIGVFGLVELELRELEKQNEALANRVQNLESENNTILFLHGLKEARQEAIEEENRKLKSYIHNLELGMMVEKDRGQ